jgi:hypothetical protein
MGEQSKVDSKRRGFLLAAGAGGAAVAGAVAVKTGSVAQPVVSEAKPKAQGYRESAHIKHYYDSARV